MNFYDILLEELSNNTNNINQDNNINQNNNIDEDNICLITKEKLEDNYITLDCGHKFNYASLYNELLKQKTNTNFFEIANIKINETKCPYCRQITPKILPYIEMNGIKIVKGVTSPKTYSMKLNDCEWIFLNGKKKGIQCKCAAIKNENGVYCKQHENMILKKKNIATDATCAICATSNSEEFSNICKKYKISTLKLFLKSFNLKVSGSKSQLIERLVQYNINNPNIILK
jgi:hypothetical protein